MVAAFKATGTYPLDRQQALKRIPGGVTSPEKEALYSRVSSAFLERLQQQRYGDETAPRRGRRLQVSPGKSWVDPEAAIESDPDPDNPDAGKCALVFNVNKNVVEELVNNCRDPGQLTRCHASDDGAGDAPHAQFKLQLQFPLTLTQPQARVSSNFLLRQSLSSSPHFLSFL